MVIFYLLKEMNFCPLKLRTPVSMLPLGNQDPCSHAFRLGKSDLAPPSPSPVWDQREFFLPVCASGINGYTFVLTVCATAPSGLKVVLALGG
jgi:hypothetical protein